MKFHNEFLMSGSYKVFSSLFNVFFRTVRYIKLIIKYEQFSKMQLVPFQKINYCLLIISSGLFFYFVISKERLFKK